MRIRQIALVAKDMDPVRNALLDLVGVTEAHVDPKIISFGLQNVVITLGDTFLEVVSPVETGTTAGRLLERRGGDGGYMVIVQVDDLATEKERLAGTTVRTVWETDRDHAKAMHLHPKDVPGAIASLDQMKPPEAWHWAGTDWDQHVAKNIGAIRAAEVQSDDPSTTAQQWAEAYGRELDLSSTAPILPFDETEVRFVSADDGRGAGLCAIDVECINSEAVFEAADQHSLEYEGDTIQVCGIRINLV